MVQINGKYRLESNNNFLNHLLAAGIPQQKAEEIDQMRPEVEVTVNGNEVTHKSNTVTKWILGLEVDEVLPIYATLKSTATLDGDTLTVNSKNPDGHSSKRIYKFSDTGFVLTMTSTNKAIPDASRTYVRI